MYIVLINYDPYTVLQCVNIIDIIIVPKLIFKYEKM